jgi:hypothetical protein
MSDEIVESEIDVDENEPVFFKAKTLNLVASTARILSWVVLAVFVLIFGGNIYNLKELTQGAAFSEIINNPTIRVWLFTNILTPLFTGATFFVVLQGVCNIIDALFEVDFNTREAK